jgi:2-polyprenyl-3-methyl-5-hydroxy-6-metoxy-1,4-benzoquinol methylase
MKTGILAGADEEGLIVGNAYDKYGSTNPVVRRLMQGFEAAMSELFVQAQPSSVHEVGCGEGYWVLRWAKEGISARGSDHSARVIGVARESAAREQLPPTLFEVRSIYELEPGRDSADLVVCAEVLEHLESPGAGLRALQEVVERHLILSVPREPLWRVLNMARGSYLTSLGNTPGHLNHWSRQSFISLVSRYFDVVETRSPLPWTMVLCRPYR